MTAYVVLNHRGRSVCTGAAPLLTRAEEGQLFAHRYNQRFDRATKLAHIQHDKLRKTLLNLPPHASPRIPLAATKHPSRQCFADKATSSKYPSPFHAKHQRSQSIRNCTVQVLAVQLTV